MLIATTFRDIMRNALEQADTLKKHAHEVGKFEELCEVLSQQGYRFTHELEVSEVDVMYIVNPTDFSNYVQMLQALSLMGAHRDSQPGMVRELINLAPECPAFWLTIPIDAQPDQTSEVTHAAV